MASWSVNFLGVFWLHWLSQMSGARDPKFERGAHVRGRSQPPMGSPCPLAPGNPMGCPLCLRCWCYGSDGARGPNGFEIPSGVYLGPCGAN
ncbi:hypothetical protein MHBO_003865 [Bonamia ostreae]|uniref:Secreted protein n=1 Tax=Bonamia ostreae TaxID=126728 RepID=A0ABV2AS34_9EUKA